MKIQHGSREYHVYIKFYLISAGNKIIYKVYHTLDNFCKDMSYEYPGIDLTNVKDYYNNLINKINTWINEGKEYNSDWYDCTIHIGYVAGELFISKSYEFMESKMCDKYAAYKSMSDGLICSIKTSGWEVYKKDERNLTRVDYYTNKDDAKDIYIIYVYKDRLILGNADIDKPSILTGNYFLYNAGTKKEKTS